MAHKVVLFLMTSWFSTTCLIDFVALPTVFKMSSNIHEAGTIGMRLFSLYNRFELMVAAVVLSISFRYLMPQWCGKITLALSSGLFLVAALYFFYLTPKITDLTNNMKVSFKIDPKGENFMLLAKEHGIYHHAYIKIDALKLVLLLVAQSLFFIPRFLEGERT